MIAATPLSILQQAAAWAASPAGAVLVTLAGIEGSSARAMGTLMAVSGAGGFAGSLSGGCLEAALVAEAQAVLAAGRGWVTRYGAGSRFIDLRLPCGGGIDVLYTPLGDGAAVAVAAAAARLAARQPAALRLDGAGARLADPPGAGGWQAGAFWLPLVPRLRLMLFGQGAELVALARLAAHFGAEVVAHSPSAEDLALLAAEGMAGVRLESTGRLPPMAGDRWSAVVFLFHDRDWEAALLPPALGLSAFYHGAVGSARTHRARLERLARAGVDAARLEGGIGLIASTRDPASLALSVLAQVVGRYQALCPPPQAAPAPQLVATTHG